jgi:tripartite-type tricarboxylate transporter receptor subunit TctC
MQRRLTIRLPFSPRRRALIASALVAGSAPSSVLFAADAPWPSRPIRVIVPFAAGGSLDVVARSVGDGLSQVLGTPVIIDNRTGANGIVGNGMVAHAAPDGYTLLLSTGAFTGSAVLYKKLPYDSIHDFVAVTEIARSYGLVLAVSKQASANNLKEFIALAKAEPERMTFGSGGQGNITHLAGELFNHLAGTRIQHVPYKGSGPAFQDVIAGHITMTFVSTSGGVQQIKAGQVRALAITSPVRAPVLPEVPTFAEAGLAGMDKLSGWYGLWAPRGTPRGVVNKIQEAVAGLLVNPAIHAHFADLGLMTLGTTPAEFEKFLAQDMADQVELVRISGVDQL